MNELKIFEHEKFGKCRFIEIDGAIYMIGTEVATALGYKNPRKAVKDHVHEEDVTKRYPLLTNGGIQKVNIINESGMYALILASKLPDAKEFKHWVTSEVLPSIRKTGTYSMTPPQIEEKSTVYIENLNITNNYIEEKPTRSTSKKHRKGDFMNDLNELLELLVYYADSIGSKRDKKSGKDMYTCPFCHSGEHGIGSTGAMHIGRNKDGKLLYYCHSCNSGGNIVNMYCQHHGITQTRENFSQIINGIRQDLGLFTEDYKDFKKSYKFRNPVQDDDLNPKTKVDEKDYTKFFNLALQNQDKAIDYLRNVRKIKYAESISQYFQLGFIESYAYEWKDNQPYKTTSAIIIPTSQYSYAWRSTTENIKKKSGTVRPLNIEVLNDKSKKYLFLVEGEFDLFSILDITNDIPNCEFSAISVNSAGNLPRFVENQIKENIQDGVTLIIALDNDTEPNPNVENFIKKGLNIAKKNKILCVVADVKTLYINKKDSNEALKFNREEFKKSLLNEVEKAKTLDITQYMADCDKIPQDKPKIYEFNYIGQIDRAFDLCHTQLRYCHQTKTWYQYDGIRLNQDNTEKFIDTLHKHIDIQCKKEVEYFKSKDNAELLKSVKNEHKYAISDKGLLGAIKGVKRREPIAITLLELDKSNLLNCKDVTLNLDNLTFHTHTITDLCTKLAPVSFKSPLNPEYVTHWNRFILDIMCEDISMAEFLQRVCGYCLFPTNKEECFFILYGATTRNGKSTLLESIKNVLGDYSKAVSSATLSERPTGKEANPEIISLIGSKLITCGELNSETLLNDTLLKSWIGNDTISARNLFDNKVLNFHLDGKLLCNCNELPPMKNDDLLNSNRIVVIPFDRHFEEHEQNKDLKRLFATPEYKKVILAWLIEGYKNYLRLGIKANMPKRVIQAIKNYQSEANTINVFLNDEDTFERIDIKNYADAVKVTDKNLYYIYVDWCKENNCKPLSSTNFKKHLKKNKHYVTESRYLGVKYKCVLSSYMIKSRLITTDMSNNNNPDRLVTISQRELDKLKK